MSNTFFVVLPSNVKTYFDNRPNSYRVLLPKHLVFNGNWECGLHSITFHHSWPTVGTNVEQYLDLFLNEGSRIRAPVPKGAYHTPEELERSLHEGVLAGMAQSRRKRKADDVSEAAQNVSEPNTKEMFQTLANEQQRYVDQQKEIINTLAPFSAERNYLQTKHEADELLLLAYKRATDNFGLSAMKTAFIKGTLGFFYREQSKRIDDIRAKLRDIELNLETEPPEMLKQSLKATRTILGKVYRTEKKTKNDVLEQLYTEIQLEQKTEIEDLKKGLLEKDAEIARTIDEKERERLNEERRELQNDLDFEEKMLKEVENFAAKKRKTPDVQNRQETPKSPSVAVAQPETQEEPSAEVSNIETTPEAIGETTFDKPEPEPLIGLDSALIRKKERERKQKAEINLQIANKASTGDEVYIEEGDEFSHLGATTYTPGWITPQVHADILQTTRFRYRSELGRFQLEINNSHVKYVIPSPQLGYVLGYEEKEIQNNDVAKYASDLKGGISHLCVYAHGLTENMIFGDTLSSLLRVVAVSGKPGDVIEKTYDTPIYSKVLPREVNEIAIEIRTMEGRLVPFDYGWYILHCCIQ